MPRSWAVRRGDLSHRTSTRPSNARHDVRHLGRRAVCINARRFLGGIETRVVGLGLLGVLVSCSLGRSRPDLAIATDSLGRQSLSLLSVRVRNLGHVTGRGIVSIAVLDSFGRVLTDVTMHHGAGVDVPPVDLGGDEGVVIPFLGPLSFRRLVDSLIVSHTRFALRAEIRCTTQDANESDNTGTRDWGQWLRLAPDSELTVRIAFLLPRGVRRAFFKLDPPSVGLIATGVPNGIVEGAGWHSREIRVHLSGALPYGYVGAVHFSLTDAINGAPLGQYERMIAYDTVPPILRSYRAIIFRNGRIAIQVYAGDKETGVPEGGVATQYSLDDGKTWRERVHAFVLDDFGHPSLFEGVIGPFPKGADILLSIRAEDLAGNANVTLPKDAWILKAPTNADRSLDVFGGAFPNGNPVFTPGAVDRVASWVRDAERQLPRTLGHSRAKSDSRLVLRRLRELRVVSDSFEAWSVHAREFASVRATIDSMPAAAGYRSVIHISIPR